MIKTDTKKSIDLFLTGRAYWARLNQAHNRFDPTKLQYTLDLSVDEKTEELLESHGVTVKNAKLGIGVKKKDPKDERGYFVSLKRSEKNSKTGELLSKPEIVDTKGNIVDSKTLIGNGSEVVVRANIFYWTNPAGLKGTSIGFSGVQILSLVPYEGQTKKPFPNAKGTYVTSTPVQDETITDIDSDTESFSFDE